MLSVERDECQARQLGIVGEEAHQQAEVSQKQLHKPIHLRPESTQ